MKKTVEIVWLILIGLSIFAYLLGYLKYINYYVVALLLITTFIKVQLVIYYYIGLKNVTLKYRLIPTVWSITVISLIAVAYYLPLDKTF